MSLPPCSPGSDASWIAMIDVTGIQTSGPGLLALICIFGPVMAAAAVAERRLGYEGLATGVMTGFVIGCAVFLTSMRVE